LRTYLSRLSKREGPSLGISPIEYRPWEGKRTEYYRRFLVISKNVFRQKLKSKWVLAILIIGIILTHVFSIIFFSVFPHDKLTPEMMVGNVPEEPEGGGNFEILGIVNLNGNMFVDGDVYGFGTLKGNGTPQSGLISTDIGFVFILGTLVLNGELYLLGGITGTGILAGNFTINSADFTQLESPFYLNGTIELTGTDTVKGRIDLDGVINGEGTFYGVGTPVSNTTITNNGTLDVNGTLVLDGALNITGNISGKGSIDGILFASGSSKEKDPDQEDVAIVLREGGFLKNGLLVIFTIMLASLVCSDLIASDLGDNSFILFFSRPIKTTHYLAGKIVGAFWLLGLYSFLPLLIFCISVMGTQSGDDYGTGLNVLGSTIGAGFLTTFMFIPYGIFISSMTKRKSYATIGIFMSFFVLTIIGQAFSQFDKNWTLINPTNLLYYSYDVLYGFSIPEGINGTLLGVILLLFMAVPIMLVYLRIHLKGVGK
jgi:ABC-type transport system involved in multi-copper enzyme maturation permease subunit